MSDNPQTLLDYVQKHHPEWITGPTDGPAEKFHCCESGQSHLHHVRGQKPGKMKALRLEVDDEAKKVTFFTCVFCHTPWWIHDDNTLFDTTPQLLAAARLCAAQPHIPLTRVQTEARNLIAQLPKGYLERGPVPPDLCPAQARLKDGRLLPLCYLVDSRQLFFHLKETSQFIGIDQVEAVEKSPYFVADDAWEGWKPYETHGLSWPLYVKTPDDRVFFIDASDEKNLFFDVDGLRGKDLSRGPHPTERPDGAILYKGPIQTIHFVCTDFGKL